MQFPREKKSSQRPHGAHAQKIGFHLQFGKPLSVLTGAGEAW